MRLPHAPTHPFPSQLAARRISEEASERRRVPWRAARDGRFLVSRRSHSPRRRASPPLSHEAFPLIRPTSRSYPLLLVFRRLGMFGSCALFPLLFPLGSLIVFLFPPFLFPMGMGARNPCSCFALVSRRAGFCRPIPGDRRPRGHVLRKGTLARIGGAICKGVGLGRR